MEGPHAYLVAKLRIDDGIPVFDSLLITSKSVATIHPQTGFVFAELLAVKITNNFDESSRELVPWLAQTRGWEWTARHLNQRKQ